MSTDVLPAAPLCPASVPAAADLPDDPIVLKQMIAELLQALRRSRRHEHELQQRLDALLRRPPPRPLPLQIALLSRHDEVSLRKPPTLPRCSRMLFAGRIRRTIVHRSRSGSGRRPSPSVPKIGRAGEEAGSDEFGWMEERGHATGSARSPGPVGLSNSGCRSDQRIGWQFGKNSTKNAIGVWEGTAA